MATQTFIIKSLYVQNTIMLGSLALVVFLLGRSIWKRQGKHAVVFSLWTIGVLWFFNSPFFGFSGVSVGEQGIHVEYGIISVRSASLPITSKWKIETYLGGIKKTRRLHYITIAHHESMKVKGREGLGLLQKIGASIDRWKKRPGAKTPR
jgi:hypothetical protein